MLDLNDIALFAHVVRSGSFAEAARRLGVPSAQAQSLMHEFGAGGVPTFISESGAKRSLLDSGAAYSNPRTLINQLQAA